MIRFVAFLLIIGVAHSVWAGRCRFETLTPARGLVASYMAGQVRQKVLEIERQMQGRGEPLQVVLLARSSTIVHGFHLLRDDPQVPWFDYLYRVADGVVARRSEYLWRNARGENPDRIASLLKLDPAYKSPHNLVYSHLGFLLKTNPRITQNKNVGVIDEDSHKINYPVKEKVGPRTQKGDDVSFDATRGSLQPPVAQPPVAQPPVAQPPLAAVTREPFAAEPVDWSYVVHLEPECFVRTKRYGESALFYDMLDQFYWDSEVLKAVSQSKHASALYTRIIVPSAELQDRLWQLTQKAEYSKHQLHQPRYNAGAVPFVGLNYKQRRQNLKRQQQGRALKHQVPEPYQLVDQNSNQWVLELLAAAQKPYGQVRTRRQAQQVLWDSNYRPSLMWPYSFRTLHLCHLIKGPFGWWDWSNLFNCEQQLWREQNLVQGVTVHSVEEYLLRNNLVAREVGVDKRWGRERSTAVHHDRAPWSVYSVKVSEAKVEQLVDVADRFEQQPCPREFEGYWCEIRQGVAVAKNSQLRQCLPDSGIALDLMARELQAAGIEILHQQQLHDGHLRGSLCGLDAGLFNVYWVPTGQRDAALKLGFGLWADMVYKDDDG